MRRLPVPLTLTVLGALAAPAAASASEIIARDVTQVSLAVDRHGRALVAYRERGRIRRVLVWGATNAIAPTKTRKQVAFRLDYAGGYGAFRRPYWKTMRNVCGRYRGPALAFTVAACTMPDGSHWALQAWRRLNRNGGWLPLRPLELHVSHWSGALPRLWMKADWNYAGAPAGPFDHIFGQFTYRGVGVYGFRATPQGSPLDTFGRNVYLDALDSPWGRGWKRVDGFLSHNPPGAKRPNGEPYVGGNFCDAMYPTRFGRVNSPGKGRAYRLTAMGPGVTPIVSTRVNAPGAYDPDLDAVLDAQQKQLAPPSDNCWNTH